MIARRLGILLALAALVAPAAARADGDVASDVLAYQDVFESYVPPDEPYRSALTTVAQRAREAGFPVKVALIGKPSDLGAYYGQFGRPGAYATQLARTLPTNPHGSVAGDLHLLVVMPQGFGGAGLGPKAGEALRPVLIDAGSGTNGLAQAAIGAIARLATANGHPVPVPAEAGLAPKRAPKAAKASSPLLYLLPVLLLFAGVAIARVRHARRGRRAADVTP